MENCPFPIELCEAVIDMILWPTKIFRYSPLAQQQAIQRTLCACALTCRAWRTRAQRLLWSYVYLKNAPKALSFASASGIASGECRSLLSALCIGEEIQGPMIEDTHPVTDLANVNELFMLPFPNLRRLQCTAVRFNLGPGVLRMRLPFFSTGSLATLVLQLCIFDSARAFLDLVWAFPNLSYLHVAYGKLRRDTLTPAGAAHLAAVGQQLRAGRRLTSVNFHQIDTLFGGSVGIMLAQSVFGPMLTHLILTFYDLDDAQCTSTLLAGEPSSFPLLILLNVKLTHRCSDSFGFGMGRIQSVLELVISSSTGSPSKLERLRLEHLKPTMRPDLCCRELVGGPKEEPGKAQRLRERFPHLRRLMIVFYPWKEETMDAYVEYCYERLSDLGRVLHFGRGPFHPYSGSPVVEYKVPRSIRRRYKSSVARSTT